MRGRRLPRDVAEGLAPNTDWQSNWFYARW